MNGSVIDLDSSDDDAVITIVEQSGKSLNSTQGSQCSWNLMGKLAESQGMISEFVNLVNMCFQFENTEGMERVLKRNLFPNYKAANKTYTESETFKNYLNDILVRLQSDPDRKFSVLKDVSDNLKANKYKKKVSFVTLNTEVSELTKRRHALEAMIAKKRVKSNNDTLDVDKTNESQIIELDELEDSTDLTEEATNKSKTDINNDIILIEDKEMEEKIVESNNQDSECIELDSDKIYDQMIIGNIQNNSLIKEKINPCKSQEENDNETLQISSDSDTEENHNNTNGMKHNNVIVPNNGAINKYEYGLMQTVPVNPKDREIMELEAKIVRLKTLIKALDEADHDGDGQYSTYMRSHKLKVDIVEAYKRICELNGEEYQRKSIQIRLSVKEGHPEGPARKLEEWLNENVQENGEPAFPEFLDVVRCVWSANVPGWDKIDVYYEARKLFKQCGEALKQRRQLREWNDLIQTAEEVAVDGDDIDRDPAETDPELMAKLEANRRIARAKENELMEHYVRREMEFSEARKLKDKRRKSKIGADTSCDVPLNSTVEPLNRTVDPLGRTVEPLGRTVEPLGRTVDLNSVKSEVIDVETVNTLNDVKEEKDERRKSLDTDKQPEVNLNKKVYKSKSDKTVIEPATETVDTLHNEEEEKDTSPANDESGEPNSVDTDTDEESDSEESEIEVYKRERDKTERVILNKNNRKKENKTNTLENETTSETDTDEDSESEESEQEVYKRERDKTERVILNKNNRKKENKTNRLENETTSETNNNKDISTTTELNSNKKKDSNISSESSSIRDIVNTTLESKSKENIENITDTSEVDSLQSGTKIKTEVKTEMTDEDIEMLFTDFAGYADVSTRVFDIEEAVIFIEISSESESDTDSSVCEVTL